VNTGREGKGTGGNTYNGNGKELGMKNWSLFLWLSRTTNNTHFEVECPPNLRILLFPAKFEIS